MNRQASQNSLPALLTYLPTLSSHLVFFFFYTNLEAHTEPKDVGYKSMYSFEVITDIYIYLFIRTADVPLFKACRSSELS